MSKSIKSPFKVTLTYCQNLILKLSPSFFYLIENRQHDFKVDGTWTVNLRVSFYFYYIVGGRNHYVTMLFSKWFSIATIQNAIVSNQKIRKRPSTFFFDWGVLAIGRRYYKTQPRKHTLRGDETTYDWDNSVRVTMANWLRCGVFNMNTEWECGIWDGWHIFTMKICQQK